MTANVQKLDSYEDLQAALLVAADTVLTPDYVRRVTRLPRAQSILQKIVDARGGQIELRE